MEQTTLTAEPHRAAIFSEDRRYRYRLDRSWDGIRGGTLLWVMLNPSKADHVEDDATLRRIIRFSREWGYARLQVVNLYALVATDPADLWQAEDPVGPENDAAIALSAREATRVCVAWGVNAPHPERVRTVLSILRTNHYNPGLLCLGRTKEGHPKHPVRLAADTRLETFYG